MNRPRFRVVAAAALTVAVAAALTACSAPASTPTGTSAGKKDQTTGALVIYTPNAQTMLDAIIPVFEKESGIKVQLVTAGTGELYQRIQSEAGNPGGDVLFGGSEAQAVQNKGLWAKYVSPNDKDMIAAGKNIDGVITPYVADGSNLLVNTQQIGDIKIKMYGCMNGCGHHTVGHIGILGVDKHGEEWYQVTLGGSAENDASLGDRTGPAISRADIAEAVERIVRVYMDERLSDEETFLQCYRRIGMAPFKARIYAEEGVAA